MRKQPAYQRTADVLGDGFRAVVKEQASAQQKCSWSEGLQEVLSGQRPLLGSAASVAASQDARCCKAALSKWQLVHCLFSLALSEALEWSSPSPPILHRLGPAQQQPSKATASSPETGMLQGTVPKLVTSSRSLTSSIVHQEVGPPTLGQTCLPLNRCLLSPAARAVSMRAFHRAGWVTTLHPNKIANAFSGWSLASPPQVLLGAPCTRALGTPRHLCTAAGLSPSPHRCRHPSNLR